MDKDSLIRLTNNLYKITLLFPKKEPLRYKMREAADDFLAKPNEKDLDILSSFFEVARFQNWVSPDEMLAIQTEYANLWEELNKLQPEKKKNNSVSKFKLRPMSAVGSSNTERQERILAFLREQGQAQVWQTKQIFPEVTKRTLRRDFESMLERGLVERIGEKNDTFYRIKISQS